MSIPWNTSGLYRWDFLHSNSEEDGNEDENAEEHELDKEATNDDMRTCLQGGSGTTCLDTPTYQVYEQLFGARKENEGLTGTLHKERKHITADKDLSEPFLFYYSMLFPIYEQDNAAKFHVNCRCEQGRSNKNEEGLD